MKVGVFILRAVVEVPKLPDVLVRATEPGALLLMVAARRTVRITTQHPMDSHAMSRLTMTRFIIMPPSRIMPVRMIARIDIARLVNRADLNRAVPVSASMVPSPCWVQRLGPLTEQGTWIAIDRAE